jgi:anti-sigma factor RsiW
MDCSHYEHLWEDYLDERLDATTREALDSHLSRCPACRESVEAARASGPLLRALLGAAPEPAMGFWTRVQADIREAENSKREFWGALEKLAWRMSWGATVAVALMAGYIALDAARGSSAAQQTEIRALVPDPAPPPTSRDEVLMSLVGGEGKAQR